MTIEMIDASDIDPAGSEQLWLPFEPSNLPGWRLERIEVYNWGTFDKQIWTFWLDGSNALLTGDIGSGKSTLVDAITTLLVPAHRAAYNKAAGADTKERSARSYVMGYYKSGRNEASNSAKPVALRDQSSYSVILGVFKNRDYDQALTLAQVFWMKEANGQPARFFVGADSELSIDSHFTKFGTDISGLRKKLRTAQAETFETFPNYSAWFKRRFGFESDQPLELFHQTVSMKSVGNLTEFVRNHMLETFDVDQRIQALITHFDDLTTAHEAVLTAERKINHLEPLLEDAHLCLDRIGETDELKICRDSLKPFFAQRKLELIDDKLQALDEDFTRLAARVAKLQIVQTALNDSRAEVKKDMAENGGDRLEQLARSIQKLETELLERQRKASRYDELCSKLDVKAATDSEQFSLQKNKITRLEQDANERETGLQNDINELSVELREKRKIGDALQGEIANLRSRKTNIPVNQVALRSAICKALNLNENVMPFAGELLQVRDEERDWEGAAERILHNFGLSILVPESHYPAVHDWVDRNHLRGRLVYFKVRNSTRRDLPELGRNSLVRKIAVKPDSIFYDWLERELATRFDFACCESREQFDREIRAVSRAGQTKSHGERYEKDDRHDISDRSRYVLGWTNAAKLHALELQMKQLVSHVNSIVESIKAKQSEMETIKDKLSYIAKLEEYTSFEELDWHSHAREITKLSEERKQLEATSDILLQLAEKLKQLDVQIVNATEQLESAKEERSKVAGRIEITQETRAETLIVLASSTTEEFSKRFPKLQEMCSVHLKDQPFRVENCDARERDLRSALDSQIETLTRDVNKLRELVVRAMSNYNTTFPLDTDAIDASLQSIHEYEKMLADLKSDGLPRFRLRFKALLNENTIREIAQFNSYLIKERDEITSRINQINESLKKIDYNEGRYIVLEPQPTMDADIRDFCSDLRACTEGTFTGSDDEAYSEAKFLQVKQLIDRFKGRSGQSEQDRRWTIRVTDVRNWFTFAASERYRQDDIEHEHYSDSAGKSGGQKEKLAYTILAASLSYQFGIDTGSKRSRSFRFVVIDEAFGRGSDDSAQFGLSLFERLGLQLLVVTPLQKIHIIEPFVSRVGFVHNEDGSSSKIRNLTIHQYQEEKERRLKDSSPVSLSLR
ncbi:MAG TPA: ATP-binding protein [Planktothrix sp.]